MAAAPKTRTKARKRRRMTPRSYDLMLIHVGAKQVAGDDREAYEDMLEAVVKVRSAAGLDAAGRRKVIDHLRTCGARIGRSRSGSARRPKPRPEIARIVRRIDALCINHPGGRKPRSWAESILRRMTGCARGTPLEWADTGQLQDVAAAIAVDVRRRGGSARPPTSPIGERKGTGDAAA